jgi:hypothetical protein
MKLEIRYGVGGAPVWHVSANPGESWRLKISRKNDASMAFESIDGTGEGQDHIPTDPGIYWFFLYTAGMNFVEKVSYTVVAPPPTLPPPPTPPTLPPMPGQPYPPPTGESDNGPIGTQCELMSRQSFGGSWWSYRNRYTGYHDRWYQDIDEARGKADRDAGCETF